MPSTCACGSVVNLQTTLVPGIEGAAGVDGADGADGQDSYGFTTAPVLVPQIGSTVTINVTSSAWMGIGQVLFIEGPGHFKVTAKPTTTSITAEFLGYQGDVAEGATIASGAQVSPGGVAYSTHTITETAIDYTVLETDEIIVVTADNKTVTLPPAADVEGKIFTIKVNAAHTDGVTIAADGSETIDGAASVTSGAQYDYVTVVSDGTEWFIIASQLTTPP